MKKRIIEEFFANGNISKRYAVIIGGDGSEIMHGLSETWHENGQQATRATLNNDNPDGLVLSWYATGLASGETTYVDGKIHGVSKAWFPNGDIRYEKRYRNGKLDGDYLEYLYVGGPMDRRVFSNGIEITEGIYRYIKHRSIENPEPSIIRKQESYYLTMCGESVLHGCVMISNHNEELLVTPYKDGRLFGRGCKFFANSELMQRFVLVDNLKIDIDEDTFTVISKNSSDP